MQKFEYKTIKLFSMPSSQLNSLGSDGWELITVIPLLDFPVGYFKYYFKRPVISTESK